ncbi:MAG: hypothetical protein Q8L97_14085 [Nitrosomonas sp.]|uniref:Nmad2 family putative nucleotide modification protein n=1 Tax=Nitrosomonas sp. TaxID=42353 RepID=UPI0027166A60|nr:hypothetical protein [Nitrosomonas sp.]MDO8895239.1 hypothetical protein [Nitrosomonas sp.]MDP1551262.1 hypothetical protein [Nitrosomonas sp.]MDP2223388.1 hypothetical protein [Nitrosomonas sp.]
MTFICYKMTHDSGFAPNPFFDHLTLATCKPAIRRTKKLGDWVAGFASQKLVNNSKNEGLTIPYQGLIYLMRIGEVMTLDAYFRDSRFKNKKPTKNHQDRIKRSGDNIYYLNERGIYSQLSNNSHGNDLETINHDTRGNVLIADMSESFYFGKRCVIPENGWDEIGFIFSKGRTFYRADSDLENIRFFLHKKGFCPGIHGDPCLNVSQEEEIKACLSCSRR